MRPHLLSLSKWTNLPFTFTLDWVEPRWRRSRWDYQVLESLRNYSKVRLWQNSPAVLSWPDGSANSLWPSCGSVHSPIQLVQSPKAVQWPCENPESSNKSPFGVRANVYFSCFQLIFLLNKGKLLLTHCVETRLWKEQANFRQGSFAKWLKYFKIKFSFKVIFLVEYL